MTEPVRTAFRPNPRVIAPEGVLFEMLTEALGHPATETGLSLVGLFIDGKVVVLGTLPDPRIDRHEGMFGRGGEELAELFQWLKDHWERARSKSPLIANWQLGQRITTGVIPEALKGDLWYLGDWHKHPGAMSYPSWHDQQTASSIVASEHRNGVPVVAPIVTVPLQVDSFDYAWGPEGELNLTQRSQVRVDWYLLSRELVNQNPRWASSSFDKVHAVIVKDNQLPTLAPLPWHLVNQARLQQEARFLKQKGYLLGGVQTKFMGDADTMMKVLVGIDHPSWTKRVVVVTDWNYPRGAVSFRFVPKAPPETPQQIQPAQSDKPQPTRRNRVTDFINELMRFIDGSPPPNQPYLYSHQPSRPAENVYLVDMVKTLEAARKVYDEPVG